MGILEKAANRAFDDRCYAFTPQVPESVPGPGLFNPIPINTGVKVLENGDVYFGVKAPEANEVILDFGMMALPPIKMEKGEDGIFTYTLKFDQKLVGPRAFMLFIDGARIISPFCPSFFSNGALQNYVEIPDPNADFVLFRDDIPHGTVASEFYYSDIIGTWERCLIYLPPDYFTSEKEYPVLYLQHGYAENETSWIYNGKVNHIMDNMIADGEAEPFIVVMNNGMFHGEGNIFANFQDVFEKSLIQCCIPAIEKKYRVIKDKWHRGVAGFSMGSMQAALYGLNDMDTFAYVGLLSGFMRRVGRPDSDLNKDLELNCHLKKMFFEKENFLKENKLFFRGIGSEDTKNDVFTCDDELIAEYGLTDAPNMVRFKAEGYRHDWAAMRIEYHEFAKLLFK